MSRQKPFIPYRTADDCIALPQGIDFRRPGQLDPWRVKEWRGRQSDFMNTLGGLQAQQNVGLSTSSLSNMLGGWPFGGLS